MTIFVVCQIVAITTKYNKEDKTMYKKYVRIYTNEHSEDIDLLSYYVGNAEDIENLYRHMTKNKNCLYFPLFSEKPAFNYYNNYAICVDETRGSFYVINASTMLELIIHGEVGEESDILEIV